MQEVGKEFKERRISLVTAESCTGGGLAHAISREPEASAILERGYVTYSYQSKEDLLEVTSVALQIYGAVSEEVVRQMAEGALKKSNAQISIAITGIGGEDCIPEEIHKGMVWFGCAGLSMPTATIMHKISGSRKEFEDQAIEDALKFLIRYIKTND